MSLALALASWFPKRVRHAFIRSSTRFAERDLDGVVVKLVETEEEAIAASHLLYRTYLERGLIAAHESRLRVTPHGILPTTHTFVARVGEKYVGTLALIEDGALGLPLEQVYPTEVAGFRGANDHVAEVGALGILPSYRRKGIVCLLYRLMREVAAAKNVTRLVVAVHPKAADIYRATLLFETFGPRASYPGLNRSAVAQGLSLDLRDLEQRYAATFGHLGPTTDNPHYVQFARRWAELGAARAIDSAAQVRISRALVAARPDVFCDLPWPVRAKLRASMPTVRMTIPDVDTATVNTWTTSLARMVPA
jgi:hypothetical protein